MNVARLSLLFVSSATCALVGCSDFQSKVDFDSKQSTLQEHQVFTDNPNTETFDGGNGITPQNQTDSGNNNDNGGGGTPTIVPPTVNAPPFSIGITNICSNRQEEKIGFTVSSAQQLRVEIVKNGQVVCTLDDTASLRSQITSRKLQIPQSCSHFVSSSEIKNNANSPAQLKILGRRNGDWKALNYPSAPFQVLYDEGSRVPFIGDWFINKNCDRRASPLFVDLRDNDTQGGDYLTSVDEGVKFNILGYNAKKFGELHGKDVAHNTPIQISWFKKPAFKLLVLPTADGKVAGIDQLFGDNTLGPDSWFGTDSLFKDREASGYAALVKFDGLKSVQGLLTTPQTNAQLKQRKALFKSYKKAGNERDLMIDREDAVYHKLKLWGDANRDGIAQDNELTSLKEEKIIAIDLVYDRESAYLETDQYGNQIKFKSVVIRCTDSDQACDLFTKGMHKVDYEAIKSGDVETENKVIFDVWFNINEGMKRL